MICHTETNWLRILFGVVYNKDEREVNIFAGPFMLGINW